jgi:hypothetical protein
LAYETFERRSIRIDQPALSLIPDGRISLNAAATRLLESASVKSVKILWDATKCGIALQATTKGDKNSYSIFFQRGRSATISPKAFLQYIGWSANRRQTVLAQWDAQQRMLEAQLPSRFVGAKRVTGV